MVMVSPAKLPRLDNAAGSHLPCPPAKAAVVVRVCDGNHRGLFCNVHFGSPFNMNGGGLYPAFLLVSS